MPKRRLAWCAAPCAILASAPFPQVLVRQHKAHPRGLTAREQQILQLLSEGQSNEEISASLFISVRTVEHHVSAILGKLGASTRKGAAKEARKLGLTHSDRVSVSASGPRNLGSRLANMGDQLP